MGNTSQNQDHALWAQTIRAFRLGLDGQANSMMVEFIDRVASVMESGTLPMGPAEAQLIDDIFQAQSRQDYLFLADILEYKLPQTRFGSVFSPPGTAQTFC